MRLESEWKRNKKRLQIFKGFLPLDQPPQTTESYLEWSVPLSVPCMTRSLILSLSSPSFPISPVPPSPQPSSLSLVQIGEITIEIITRRLARLTKEHLLSVYSPMSRATRWKMHRIALVFFQGIHLQMRYLVQYSRMESKAMEL